MLLPPVRQGADVKSLCRSHYERQRRTGSLRPLRPRRPVRAECAFQGCGKLAVAKGLCQSHHKQRKKGQRLRPLRPFYGTKGPCRFDGCPKPRASGGYCAGHAAQYYSGRPVTPLLRPRVDCDFPGCTKRHFALGCCQGHWRQLRENRPLAPLREARMAYGPRLHRHLRACPSECTPRRLRCRAHQGHGSEARSPLHRFEEVRHKNGIRHDSRPESLELWSAQTVPTGPSIHVRQEHRHVGVESVNCCSAAVTIVEP